MYFSRISNDPALMTQLLAKAVTFTNDVNGVAIRSILNDFEIHPFHHVNAFNELVGRCASGGHPLCETKVEALRKQLTSKLDEETMRKNAQTLARTLCRGVFNSGGDERMLVAIASELTSLAADAIRERRGL